MDRTTTMRVHGHRITLLCAAIAAAPKSRSPGLRLELLRHVLEARFHFYQFTSHPCP
ncbi:hypothetical protein BGY98DRAFT_1046181, partial [Russula aff. rugulosa BPL654]